MTRIDDSDMVQAEYRDASRLATRFRPLREYHDGPDVDYEIVLELHRAGAHHVLEVGSGDGRLGKLLQYWYGAATTAIDQSEHMVDLARVNGIDALVGDVQQLPFRDAEFDAVVANFMLYHLPDLSRGVREIARVLKPGGLLVATTLGEFLPEVWNQVEPGSATLPFSFGVDNGAAALANWFDPVTLRYLRGTATFPDRAAVVDYMRATLTRAHLADRLPEFDGPLTGTTEVGLFTAHRSAAATVAA
jgi:SAM-dependent methyltransferase